MPAASTVFPPDTFQAGLVSTVPLKGWAIFSPASPAFAGHFAGHPILPGFLHLELALKMLRLAGIHADLQEIRNAKFLRAIPPATRIDVQLDPLNEAGAGWFALSLSESAHPITECHLRITLAI